jgi:hypothetical protein
VQDLMGWTRAFTETRPDELFPKRSFSAASLQSPSMSTRKVFL